VRFIRFVKVLLSLEKKLLAPAEPTGEGGAQHWLQLEKIYEERFPPLETRFEDEVEKYWNRKWGAPTEIGRLRMVLLHRPGREMESVTSPYENWRYTTKPNIRAMIDEHETLVRIFKDEGVEVVIREAEEGTSPRLVKSIYCRDPSFSVKGGMVISRMYDSLRRGEERYHALTYSKIGCPIIRTINGSGIIEGGGVTYLDETHVCITTGYRTNEEGARQAAEVMRTSGVEEVINVPLYDGHEPIHMVDKHTCVRNRLVPWFFLEYLRKTLHFNILDGRESGARASVALKPGRVLIAEDAKVRRFLESQGIDVIEAKIPNLVHPINSGSIHCLAMAIVRDSEPT
jgi:N-dimethylarginine dimethylaminohydrolase